MSTSYESNKNFKNWSENVDITPARTYRPTSVDDVVAIVTEAQRSGRRVRPVGAGWSFGDVLATPDYLVETKGLTGVLGLSQGRTAWGPIGFGFPLPTAGPETSPILIEALRDDVLASSRRFVHVRAGTTIKQLYTVLGQRAYAPNPRPAWTLPTMGGASGQTIAGAIQTGTHGGHFDLPPMADMVQAMLLVGPDGRKHWIERAGAGGITDPARVRAALGLDAASVHHDDAWFRAAVVAMGNLGFVVEYVLEVREQYGISEVVQETTWRDLAPMLTPEHMFVSTRYSRRDASRRWIDEHVAAPGRRPAAVGVFINPYRLSDDYDSDPTPDRRVMLVTHASSTSVDGAHVGPAGASMWDQMHLIAGFERARKLERCRLIVDKIIDVLRNGNGTQGHYRVDTSVLDTSSGGTAPILSLEIAVTTAGNRHIALIDRLLQIVDEKLASYWKQGIRAKFAGGFNLRFTRPTEAYLGMQAPTGAADEHFCHIEIIAMREQILSGRPLHADYTLNDMENYTEEFTDAFERATDEFGARLHWGQLSRTHRHDPDRYPHFPDWLRIKNLVTNNGAYRTFENDFSERHLRPQHDVSLRAQDGHYVCAEGGGGGAVVANRDARREWETFKLIELGGGRVALRAYSGHYVTAEGGGGGPLIANRPHIRAWETFALVDLGDRRVALRAANGQYVCAEGGGGRELVANRDLRQSWETFTMNPVG